KGTKAMKVRLALVALACCLVAGAGWAGYCGLAGSGLDDATPAPRMAETPPQAKPAADMHGDPLPAGAVVRLGQDRWLHGEIAAAGFLPDGKTIVTAANGDATIRFWEFPTGKEIRRITLPYATANAALSKDGKVIAICDGRTDDGAAEIYVHDLA